MPNPPAEQTHAAIRGAIRALCAEFPAEYHRKIDAARGYPEAFVDALTKAGWMAALIPEEYGGAGLGLTEASVIMEEINRSGGNSGACHGQMYNMGTLLRHGSVEQKQRYLPGIAAGELRLQSMGVTEPGSGTDTASIKTTAVKQGGRYVINGQKVWISRIQHSDLMILLARTTPLAQVKKKSEGLSIFMFCHSPSSLIFPLSLYIIAYPLGLPLSKVILLFIVPEGKYSFQMPVFLLSIYIPSSTF